MPFGDWVKCRKFKNHKQDGWVEGHLLDWNSSMFPLCSALIFDPESIKLWVWEFNFDVLQRFHTLVFGNTRPDRYAVLSHREISWRS